MRVDARFAEEMTGKTDELGAPAMGRDLIGCQIESTFPGRAKRILTSIPDNEELPTSLKLREAVFHRSIAS
ncbi:MAG: hypothetical protein ACI8UO_006078 [Verrucomicrobiales bacterium]|jgi:hypothetical protein